MNKVVARNSRNGIGLIAAGIIWNVFILKQNRFAWDGFSYTKILKLSVHQNSSQVFNHAMSKKKKFLKLRVPTH